MNVVDVADVATHCENVVRLLHSNAPGVQGRLVGEDVSDAVGDEVGEVMAGVERVVAAADMVGDVVAVSGAVVVMALPSSVNVIVGPLLSVSIDPDAEGAVDVEELPIGKGGTVVGVDAVVVPEAVPVVVVPELPLISKPGPGSGVMESWP